jgi:ElaB/YqjD/DUF883 family membrane-anchored ribosome-binding protein
MKKFFMLAIAVVAMTFASCGNKTNNETVATDSTAEAVEGAQAEAQNIIDQLKEKIEAKDASAIQNILTKAQEYVKANPETAKEYLTKVQEFVKENAEKIKAAVGDNAIVNGLVTTLTTTSADDVVNKFVEIGTDAKAVIDDTQKAIENAPQDMKDAADKAVEDTKTKLNEKANEQVNKTKDAANKAIDKGVNDVKGKLGL